MEEKSQVSKEAQNPMDSGTISDVNEGSKKGKKSTLHKKGIIEIKT